MGIPGPSRWLEGALEAENISPTGMLRWATGMPIKIPRARGCYLPSEPWAFLASRPLGAQSEIPEPGLSWEVRVRAGLGR